jgi:hypothetical protein
MAKNYALEVRIKEACEAAGVLKSALDDFIVDYDAFKFTEEELPGFIEQCKKDKPHRFAIQSDHDVALCTSAFVAKNKTDEGRLLRSVGPDRFADLKTMYANGLPVLLKKSDGNGSTNPWSAEAWDTRRQISIVKGLGLAKAAEMAASCGSFVGATSPKSKNYTSFKRTA